MSELKIIAKMKKMLALASSSNEHEALAATRQLHVLLARHNISIDTLNKEEETVGQEPELVSDKPWKRQVAMAIARLYFCEFYIDHGKGKINYFFVGTEANRNFAICIFKMVVKTVEQESRRECTKLYGKRNSSFCNSFRNGAMVRIRERCKELICDAKEGRLEDEEGTLLPVLLSTYDSHKKDALDWLAKNTNLVMKKCTMKSNNAQGFMAGQEAGGRVQLSRAIQSNSSPKLLS